MQVGALQRDLVALAVEQAAHLLDGAGLVVEAGEHVHVGADERLGAAAEHRAERRVDLDDLAADRDDHDPGGGVAEDGAEAGVASAPARAPRQVPHACDVARREGRDELRLRADGRRARAGARRGCVRARRDRPGPRRPAPPRASGRWPARPGPGPRRAGCRRGGRGGGARRHWGRGPRAPRPRRRGASPPGRRGPRAGRRLSDVISRSAFRTARRGAALRTGERVTLPSRHPTRRADDARETDTRPGSDLGLRPAARPQSDGCPDGGRRGACRRW